MPHTFRFFGTPDRKDSSRIVLKDEEAHHALHVVRIKVGDAVDVFDGLGNEWACTVEAANRREVECVVQSRRVEVRPEPRVTVSVAWLNKDRAVEELIQRCTEIGAGEFRFFRGDYSSRAPKQTDKWTKWAIESCKQCGRLWLPEFHVTGSIGDVLNQDEISIAGLLQDDPVPLRDCLNQTQNVNIIISPEGDFSAEEIATLAQHGTHTISLGSGTYRSQLAATLLASLVLYELDRLGYPKDKPTRKAAKPAKETRGRKPTVDYPRDDQLTFPITKEINTKLGKAVAVESGKRYPQRVDKGLIIEEALTAWFKKRGY